jgi:hypothetical protein
VAESNALVNFVSIFCSLFYPLPPITTPELRLIFFETELFLFNDLTTFTSSSIFLFSAGYYFFAPVECTPIVCACNLIASYI